MYKGSSGIEKCCGLHFGYRYQFRSADDYFQRTPDSELPAYINNPLSVQRYKKFSPILSLQISIRRIKADEIETFGIFSSETSFVSIRPSTSVNTYILQ